MRRIVLCLLGLLALFGGPSARADEAEPTVTPRSPPTAVLPRLTPLGMVEKAAPQGLAPLLPVPALTAPAPSTATPAAATAEPATAAVSVKALRSICIPSQGLIFFGGVRLSGRQACRPGAAPPLAAVVG
ncbi:hypothetical protein GAY29_02290 [Azospirillum brasilense]|uniref:hypothetical protein n=1 Tax=Azospirillum brasilense TaxID=192 RepID=UPI00190DB770|nr:hypothetical protein [Azospirillum brasilense]MBK3731942.1 hypothetical protein [Azospirillum brasilense]